MKKVIMYCNMYCGKKAYPLFIGTENDCINFILNNCKPLADGHKIYRIIKDKDGDIYDIGAATLYQIIE